jgi:drug/metabolite transporter (DMT)-like permease
MLVYVALFVATNAITKILATSLPLTQIAAFRYAFAVPLIVLVLALAPNTSFRVNRLATHVGRGCLAAAGSLCGYAAIAMLPLGDATALFYVAPLLVGAGAAFMLRERPGALRGVCIALGFAGVLLIARPHFESVMGVLAGLGNAMCAAAGVLLIRHVRNSEGALSLALTTSVVCVVVFAYPTFAQWHAVTLQQWSLLAGLGILGGLATVLLNLAYHQASAPLLASIDYMSVPGSLMAGAIVWGDLPAPAAFAGGMIVVAAGILSVASDQVRVTSIWVGATTTLRLRGERPV